MEHLVVRGAKQHNLRNVTCSLPRNRLVVLTGPSGSGKSSLAFDTIYAEGQRRYVESLSAYARQFLDQLPKPDVESIEGLSPAIAIEQKALGKSPRSTVGTVTEIADYLRLLFARVGTPHCPVSGEVLRAYTVQEMVDAIMARGEGTRLALLSPVSRGKAGDLSAELAQLRRDGFVRARLDGALVELGDQLEVDASATHDLEVVVDRIAVREGSKGRITDSVELALEVGDRTLFVDALDGTPPAVMSERLVCWEHGASLPPLEPRLFSFNSPHGACPRCDGLGVHSVIDPARVVPDPARSLREGAVAAFGRRGSVATASEVERAVRVLSLDPDLAWQDLPAKQREQLLYGVAPGEGRGKSRQGYEGIIVRLQRLLLQGSWLEGEDTDFAEGAISKEDVGRFEVTETCSACGGTRLRLEALSVKVHGHTLAELCALPLARLREQLVDFLRVVEGQSQASAVAVPLVRAVSERLGFLLDVGLDYLSLDRPAGTLSGGEGQRIRLATQIGASLVGVLYVLDEPSVGLHARDNDRLLLALRRLVDKGNSVLVVEHDRDAILAADWVVDMGPKAGVHGGTIVSEGTPAQIMADPASVTGPYLSSERRLSIPRERTRPTGKALVVRNARAHNSGSGKCSLIVDTLLRAARAQLYGASNFGGPCDGIDGLEFIDKVINIDQAPIGRTPRSNPATYTGIFTHLRELYASVPEARARGYKAGRFSFNVKGGRCEACEGEGVRRIEMHFLPDVYVTCEACNGLRYNRETLEVKYRGMSIAEALGLTVEEAARQFEALPKVMQKLNALLGVGLGYVELGQAATTLSGGEAQRVKLAAELARRATGQTLYVLDEPTTGLHFQDIELLTRALLDLRDAGNSILIIEHNIDLIACSDWVIDMGPEGGDQGGQVVACGTPEEVARTKASHTGRYLARALNMSLEPAAPTSNKAPREPRARAKGATKR
jgi:excinuclease ABC subunit A